MLLLRKLTLVLAGAALAAPAAQTEPPATVAFVGADVLPMTGADRLTDQTVIVSGDRIAALGPRKAVAIPPEARRIEADGLTMMPGLVDMHIHLDNPAGEKDGAIERGLGAMLAQGITTTRGALGTPSAPALRARIENGEVAAPRLYVATPHITAANTPDPDSARVRAREAKAAGFDFLKVHDVDGDAWQALIDEGGRLGIPVIGHVADRVGFFRALEARQQIEHLESAPRALLPPESPASGEVFGQIPPPRLVAYLNGVTDSDVAAFAARARALGGYHTPTLALFENLYDTAPPAEALLSGPGMHLVSGPMADLWRRQRTEFYEAGAVTPDSGRTMLDLRRRIVRAFHRAGIPLMAGSGAPILYQAYGPGLFRELEVLVETGLTPMEALRSATVVPRDYLRSLPNGGSSLGWPADFGTIESGARADLILLKGDPSMDLGALRKLEMVVAGGRLLDRVALDRLLERIAAETEPQAD